MKHLRIVCLYPNHGEILPKTQACLDRVEREGIDGWCVEVRRARCTMLAQGRNFAVTGWMPMRRNMTLGGYDVLGFVDADIAGWSPRTIARLLSHNLPVVGAAYTTRSRSALCAGYWGEIPGHAPVNRRVPLGSRGIRSVHWIGCGLTMYQRDALQRIEAPWFRHETVSTESGIIELTTDDTGFGIAAGRANVETYIDCGTVVEHIIERPARPNEVSTMAKEMDTATVIQKAQQSMVRGMTDGANMLVQALKQAEERAVNAERALAEREVADSKQRIKDLEQKLAEIKKTPTDKEM